MSGRTPLGFTTVTQEDPSVTVDSYRFFDHDRKLLDAYLQALFSHRHGELGADDVTPLLAPSLELDGSLGGQVPSGTRVYYKYALVDPYGLETAASPESFIDTPTSVDTPGAPAGLTLYDTGGVLLAGSYYYRLTAYADVSTVETLAGDIAFKTATSGSTNRFEFTLPTLPAGASGFNVYRRRPGSGEYVLLSSIDMDVVTPPTTFEDDGSLTEDVLRRLPTTNRTGGGNAVVVTIPGATPLVPEGFTWRIYRTYLQSVWTESLVAHVVEETSEGSGIITTEFEDFGYTLGGGEPQTVGTLPPTPDAIDLGTDVTGRLPMGRMAFPVQLPPILVPGPLDAPMTGTFIWVCEYPALEIVAVRPCLGDGSTPVATPVIVDVLKAPSSASPSFTSIFGATPNPQVDVGDTRGDRVTPDTIDMVRGDMLRFDLLQDGGGASPTDFDLTIHVYCIAYGFPDDEAYEDGESGGTGGPF